MNRVELDNAAPQIGSKAAELLLAVYDGKDTAGRECLIDWRDRLQVGLANVKAAREKPFPAVEAGGKTHPNAIREAYDKVVPGVIGAVEALIADLNARILTIG